jgi:diguanylate cyclase (GGDEF)-like protein
VTRAQMMVHALLVVTFLLGALSVTVARGRRDWRAVELWGWGSLAYGFGLAITQVKLLPAPLTSALGNSLIAWAPVLSVLGVMHHSTRRLDLRWTYGFLFLTVALIVVNNIVMRLPVINYLAPSPIAMVLFAFAAWAVWTRPAPGTGRAARFMVGMMVFAVTVWTLRNAFLLGMLGTSTDRDAVDFIVSLFAIAQIVVGVALTMAFFWVEVTRMQAELSRQAFSDPLTGLPNRRAFTARFDEALARARRQNEPLSLLIFDLDHFKQVNDRHGHAAGDAVLRHVATVVGAASRGEDIFARIGGEEFGCLLPGLDGDAAIAVADRLRAQLAEVPALIGGHMLNVTLSGGLATFPNDGDTWDRLFSEADARLYRAKQGGRNRVASG